MFQENTHIRAVQPDLVEGILSPHLPGLTQGLAKIGTDNIFITYFHSKHSLA